MNFFTTRTTWSNLELWLFKVCVFTGGISVGLYFCEELGRYFIFGVPFFMVTAAWSLYL